MKQLTFTLFAAIMLAFTTQVTAQKDWTLLVYVVGADLETNDDAATNDIAEMMSAGTTDFVNVVVVKGGAKKAGWQTPTSWLINNGTETSLPFTPTNNRMSTPQNVTEFINWGITNYPAQSYALVFWNHGGDIRGYGNDENFNGKGLKVPEIKQAISSSTFIQNGGKFDVIGFDACLMATLEVQSALKDYAYYYIASEELEPGHGWDYKPIVEGMESGNALYGDQIGKIIVDAYKAQSVDWETNAITLGVMDLFYISDLEAALDVLFTKIKQNSLVSSLQKSRSEAEEYGKETHDPELSEDMVDIGHLMARLKVNNPTLAVEADSVLAVLQRTVVYSKHDAARPHATGISMYLPHNVLSSEGETDWVLNTHYAPLSFSQSLKDFVKDTYVPIASSDNTPPSGQTVNFPLKREDSAKYSAILIQHDNDLEEVQIVLDEEFVGFPNEYILLGSALPDTVIYNPDGTEIYAYEWDGEWLGINGHPVYISDIHRFEVEDSMGNTKVFTRVHIPAILNPGPDEREIVFSYRYDEDFNEVLESIVPAKFGDSAMVVPKERIFLQPGDKVQMVYEVFNELTGEDFFQPDPNAIFDIVNGNNDLVLEHDPLEPGNYHIGYVLLDHSHNDTIIFDTQVFTVAANSIEDGFAVNNISMYPNPADGIVSIENNNFTGKAFSVRLLDINGRVVFHQTFHSREAAVNTKDISSGIYSIELIGGGKRFYDKLIITH